MPQAKKKMTKKAPSVEAKVAESLKKMESLAEEVKDHFDKMDANTKKNIAAGAAGLAALFAVTHSIKKHKKKKAAKKKKEQ